MPLSVCRRTVQLGADGDWFSPTSTPQPGSQTRALEDILAVLAQHLLGGHAEELLRGPVDAGDAEFGIVQNQGVGKLVEHRFQNAGSLPAWRESWTFDLRYLT